MWKILCVKVFLLGYLGLGLRSHAPEEHALYLATHRLAHEGGRYVFQSKVFWDDLQNALKANSDLQEPVNQIDVCAQSKWIESYWNKKVQMRSSDQLVYFTLDKCTLIGEMALLEFNLSSIDPNKGVQMNCELFLDLFPSQQNIVQWDGTNQLFERLSQGNTKLSWGRLN